MEKKKVYIVTSGCYSDYGINAVLSTEALADEWIKDANLSYTIEEHDLDDDRMESRPRGYLVTSIQLVTGKVEFIYTEYFGPQLPDQNPRVFAYASYPTLEIPFVTHKDEGTAAKVALEKRAQLLAQYPLEMIKTGRYDRDTMAFIGTL